VLAFLLLACVIDRTGQSATDTMRRELADHGRRLRELETISEDMSRRVSQLEEVTRARGQEEILKMETMEQLREEVARIRGDFEVLQREYGDYEQAGIGFQQSATYQLVYLETRVQQMEKSLGVKVPPPPARDPTTGAILVPDPATAGGAGGVAADGADGGGAAADPGAPPSDGPKTPEEFFALIERNLAEGNGGVARAVAKRFVDQNAKSDRVPEAWYRIGESWQNEASYRDAAASFMVVADKYPQSTWAPWSTLRIGECFLALGDKSNAKLFFQDVVDKWPKSKAAKEAKAQLAK
jgi:tol-pal system protein YbgF